MQSEAAMTPATRLAGVIALAVLAGVWSWWGAAEGAYFGTVMYPGLIVLAAAFVLVALGPAWTSRLRLSAPARVALGALLGLAAWSGLSALWSPAPDVAVADAQRIFGYALAFGLGLWLATLLGNHAYLAMAPLAFAGLFCGIVAIATLLTGEDFNRYIDEGTLQYPIGYRNANAAFFLIAAWPAVHLAAARRLDWRLRSVAAGTATLCIQLGMLSQSRGSMLAFAAALAVFLVISQERARVLGWLALVTLPALVVIPALTDLYETAGLEAYAGTGELRAAGRAVLAGTALSVGIGAVAIFTGRRLPESASRASRANRAVAVGAGLLVVAGAISFTVATGNPVAWAGDRVDEFLTQGTPGSEGDASRFNVNAGTERDDLWRVALKNAGDDPLLGVGGGGFQYSYPLDRGKDGIESVRDAHSVELEVVSELGIPGLALLALALGGAAMGAWRSRRSPAFVALSACALTAGAYWLAHASLDWFWTYAAITAPVFALLGSACAGSPGLASADSQAPRWRKPAGLVVVVVAVSMIPPFLAERYVNSAYAGWRSNLDRALTDLDRARDLNRLSIEPLLAAGAIARERGDRETAIAEFEAAAAERPEEWATHYFLAVLTRRHDPDRARAELELALDQNPRGAELRGLARSLKRDASAAQRQG